MSNPKLNFIDWDANGDGIDETFEFEYCDLGDEAYMNKKQKNIWRPATEEEKAEMHESSRREQLRLFTSMQIGGIDERGNYTALHHRGEEKAY